MKVTEQSHLPSPPIAKPLHPYYIAVESDHFMQVIESTYSKAVGFRHPRMPSPAVQESIQRQYQYTIISFGMARPVFSPPIPEQSYRDHIHLDLDPWTRCFSTTSQFCSVCPFMLSDDDYC